MSYEAFARAVEIAGSQSAFQLMTGMSQQRISYRLKLKKMLPAEFVLAAEAGTGVPRHDLRPDLYPPEALLGSTASSPAVAACGSVVACDRPALSKRGQA